MTACLNASDFQEYLETPAPGPLAQHVDACGKCRTTFHRMAATDRQVNIWLSALASPLEEAPLDITRALARVVNPQPDHVGNLLAPGLSGIPYLSFGRNLYASAAIHAGVFALLLIGATSETRLKTVTPVTLIDPQLKPFIPEKDHGGGGGGARQPEPVPAGRLPKPAPRQFVPPQIVEQPPKLALQPSIVVPPDAPLPQSTLPTWGDPLARLAGLSNGAGSGGGMGYGKGGGVGNGAGAGFGPGSNGGVGGGIFRVGGDVSAPMLVLRVDPEYSEEARKAKYSGVVLLSLIVDTEGRARDIQVAKSLGMGLDEKAVEAVRKWTFKPGRKDGHPVNVRAVIEVYFRLL